MPVVHVVGLSEAPSPASTASPALEEAQARVREVEEAKVAAEKALQAQIDDLKKQLEHAGSQEAARAKEQQDQVQELQAEAAKLRKQLDERPMIDVPAAVKEESPKVRELVDYGPHAHTRGGVRLDGLMGDNHQMLADVRHRILIDRRAPK
jgi:seryl-tRNA synthetase